MFPKGTFLLAASSALLTLVACEQGEEPNASRDADIEATEIPAEPATVSIADTLGTFEGTVGDLAVWQHPSVPFLSAVLAPNGAAGLFLVPVDSSAPTNNEGVFTGGVAVQYAESGPLIAAYDGGQGTIRLFSLNEANSTLSEVSSIAAPGGADALCFGGETLYAVGEEGNLTAFTVTAEDGAAALMDGTKLALTAQDCASVTGKAYFLTAEGIVAADDGRIVAQSPADAKGLTGWSLDVGPVFVTLSGEGTLRIGDLPLETQGFAGETENVTFTTIAAGSGNYGGVFRDGLLAAVTSDNELVLIPWASIAAAAGVEGRTQSPRGDRNVAAGVGDLTDIPVIELAPVETRAPGE